jgi:serine/threonine protein kinase
MAPEIYFSLSRMASYTIKSDIWSIGVILHEMLYQMHPFHGNSHNFKKEKRAKVMKKYGILDKIIEECLVFNPSLRINWS